MEHVDDEHIDDEDFEEVDIDFGDDTSNGDFEPVKDKIVTENEIGYDPEQNDIPRMCDYEWTDYVLSDLHKTEIYNDNPTVDGLRRLVSKFVGQIIGNNTYINPHSNNKYAVATVNIEVLTIHGERINYSGAADVIPDSVDHPFDKHLVAMAETRAEGRALRKILQLRRTVAAEELAPNDKIIVEESSDVITDNQINFIDLMSRDDDRGMNIDIIELINNIVGHLDNLSHDDGIKLINKLNKYQQKKDSIPETLVGYKSNWKNSLEVTK